VAAARLRRELVQRFLITIVVACLAMAKTFADEPPRVQDHYGDPLPRHAVARLGTVRFLPTAQTIEKLAYSPNGKLLASLATAMQNKRFGIQIWDIKTGKDAGPPQLNGSDILDMAWAPDNRRIVIGTKTGSAVIWDVVSGKTVHQLSRAKQPINAVAWSKDGRWIAHGTAEGPVIVRAASNGKAWKVLQQPASRLAFSRNNKYLAAAAKGTVSIWNVATGMRWRRYTGTWAKPYSLEFSPDGKTLAMAAGKVYLYDLRQKARLTTVPGAVPNDVTLSIAFSPDGKTLVTAGISGDIRLWDVAGKKSIRWFKGQSSVFAATFSPDGKTLTIVRRRIMFLDPSTGKTIERFAGHIGFASRLVFSADGKSLYSFSNDHSIRRWTIRNGKQSRVYRAPDGSRGFRGLMSISRDETMFAVPQGKSVLLLDAKTGRTVAVFKGHRHAVSDVRFSPVDDLLISQSSDATMFWDTKLRRKTGEIPWKWGAGGALQSLIMTVRFSPNGKQIAVGWWGNPHIVIFDVKSQLRVASLKAGGTFAPVFAYSFDSQQVATIDQKGHLKLLDSQTGKVIRESNQNVEHKPTPFAMAWSPDGRLIAAADLVPSPKANLPNRFVVRVYSAANLRRLIEYEGHIDTIRSLAFSPDSSLLVSGSQDTTILVWSLMPIRKMLSKKKHPRAQTTPLTP